MTAASFCFAAVIRFCNLPHEWHNGLVYDGQMMHFQQLLVNNTDYVTNVQPVSQFAKTVTFRSYFLDSIDIFLTYGIIIKNEVYVTLHGCFM